jgi:hypothetical protein
VNSGAPVEKSLKEAKTITPTNKYMTVHISGLEKILHKKIAGLN